MWKKLILISNNVNIYNTLYFSATLLSIFFIVTEIIVFIGLSIYLEYSFSVSKVWLIYHMDWENASGVWFLFKCCSFYKAIYQFLPYSSRSNLFIFSSTMLCLQITLEYCTWYRRSRCFMWKPCHEISTYYRYFSIISYKSCLLEDIRTCYNNFYKNQIISLGFIP